MRQLRDGQPCRTRRAQHRELVRNLELRRAEAEKRAGASARRPGRTLAAGGLEHFPTQQDTLQVRRRHVVSERRCVEVPELGDRELGGG